MCWTTICKPKKIKAEEDIVCYKFLFSNPEKYNKAVPYYRSLFAYNLDKAQQVRIDINITELTFLNDETRAYECHEAFHSYGGECHLQHSMGIAMVTYEGHPVGCYFTNDEYINPFQSTESLYIHKCIIPKGAVYYKNEKGEIISSDIIVTPQCVKINDITFNIGLSRTFKELLP